MKNKSYKIVLLLICLLLTACSWTIDPRQLDQDVKDRLELYPDSNYTIIILPSRKQLDRKFYEIYRQKNGSPAFYHRSQNIIYIVNGCRVKVIKHEIAHAIAESICPFLSTKFHHLIIRIVF